MWWALGGLVVVLGTVIVLLALVLPRGTLYFAHSGGFRALGTKAANSRTTDRAGLGRAIEALRQQRRFDCLGISTDLEERESLSLTLTDGSLKFGFVFTIATDSFKEEWVRSYFRERGIEAECSEFNLGLGPELEARALDFPVSPDADLTGIAVELLAGIDRPTEIYYVTASSIQEDGPGDSYGLIWRPHRDRLKDVL